MDKVEKALTKLNAKEIAAVKSILLRLLDGKLLGMDIQKLQGHTDIFRIRKGTIRIIYRQKNSSIHILAIEKRSEKTYRNF